MSDKEYIGVIMDELLDMMEYMKDNDDINNTEKHSLEFGIKILKYFALLCYDEGVDLELNHSYKDIVL